MLVGMKNCTSTTISSEFQSNEINEHVKAITLGNDAKIPDITLASNILYARSFYPQLLETIRSEKRVILLSNPGTG
jgi:hypothetical protein